MSEARKKHLLTALEQDIRYDGRSKEAYRDISIELGVSSTAEGSAIVTIGETKVIAGVKLEMGTPYPDTPDQGNLMVGAELLPIASNDFESGPPSIESIELARVMDRAVRESGCIDLKKLCIEEGEKVWTVICDICTLNAAGNLFDAASIAVTAALQSTTFPEVVDGVVDYKKKTKDKLPLNGKPLSITVWQMGEHLFVDPLPTEEAMCEARLTVGSIDADTICSLQKGGTKPLREENVAAMLEMSTKKAEEIRAIVDKAMK